MSLRDFLDKGLLKPHRTDRREIADLLEVVDRDLNDASFEGLSPDRRFATAYNAVLQLATAALYAARFRASRGGHHWITISVIPDVLGEGFAEQARYFDRCRIKRHNVDYDRVGTVSERDVTELLREAASFREGVLAWLKEEHPDLCPIEEPGPG